MKSGDEFESRTEVLTVLGDDGRVVVGSSAGYADPVAVLTRPVMDDLCLEWHRAQAEEGSTNAEAMARLHATVGAIVGQYVQTCNKFGDSGGNADRALVIAELEQLAKQLREINPGGPLPESVKCSFCGRGHLRVQRLIEGVGATICGDCLKECWALLNEASAK